MLGVDSDIMGHKDMIIIHPFIQFRIPSGNEAGQCGTASAPPTKISLLNDDNRYFTPHFPYLPAFIHH